MTARVLIETRDEWVAGDLRNLSEVSTAALNRVTTTTAPPALRGAIPDGATDGASASGAGSVMTA